MKKLVESIMKHRIVPAVYVTRDDGKRFWMEIFDNTSIERIHFDSVEGIGICCGHWDILAIDLKEPNKETLQRLKDILSLSDKYKWTIASDNTTILVIRVYGVPSDVGIPGGMVTLSGSLGASVRIRLRQTIPVSNFTFEGEHFEFLYPFVIEDNEPPKELEYRDVIAALGKFCDVNKYNVNEQKGDRNLDSDHEETVHTPLIALRTYDKVPPFVKNITDRYSLPREKDIAFLSLLAVLSASMPNVVSKHRKRKIYSPFNVVVTAPPASGKGALSDIIRVIEKIEENFRATYEKSLREYKLEYARYKAKEIEDEPIKPKLKTIQVAADTSFTALYKQLLANGEWGLMFESEIDVFVNAGRQEWGNYSQLIRKAVHHESHKLDRVSFDSQLSLKAPKIAVVMSGTPDQFFKLFPSVQDGLYSRFIVYYYELKTINLINPFSFDDSDFFDTQVNTDAEFVFDLYQTLVSKGHELEFRWTKEQSQKLYEYFSKLILKVRGLYGKNATGIVLRHMLFATRIGMVLAVVKEFERDKLKQTTVLTADDSITDVVLDITETCEQHSLLMMANVQAMSKTRNVDVKSLNMLRFLNALPEKKSFKTKEALFLGRSVKVSDRSVGDYLASLCKSGHLEQIGHGEYRRIR